VSGRIAEDRSAATITVDALVRRDVVENLVENEALDRHEPATRNFEKPFAA
jgi:hypothetical protein